MVSFLWSCWRWPVKDRQGNLPNIKSHIALLFNYVCLNAKWSIEQEPLTFNWVFSCFTIPCCSLSCLSAALLLLYFIGETFPGLTGLCSPFLQLVAIMWTHRSSCCHALIFKGNSEMTPWWNLLESKINPLLLGHGKHKTSRKTTKKTNSKKINRSLYISFISDLVRVK